MDVKEANWLDQSHRQYYYKRFDHLVDKKKGKSSVRGVGERSSKAEYTTK